MPAARKTRTSPLDTTTLRTNPAQQRSLALVELILSSATMIANEKGLAAITTSTVAKRARVSTAAVYRYFPDRLAIVYALIVRDVEIYVDVLHGLYLDRPPTSLADLIHFAVEARATMYRDQSNIGSLLLVEVVGHADAALNRSRLVADVLVATLYDTFDMPSNQNQIKRVELGVRVGDILIHRAFKLDPIGDAFILREAEEVLLSYLTAIYSDHEALGRHQHDQQQ